MPHVSVRRRWIPLSMLAAVATLVACGQDKRVKQLELGITRDSALTIIGRDMRGSASDSFPNVYMKDLYLVNGTTLQVLYFTPNNEKQGRDSVALAKLTPLVFADNHLVAKGWKAWDSVSTANGIPIRARK